MPVAVLVLVSAVPCCLKASRFVLSFARGLRGGSPGIGMEEGRPFLRFFPQSTRVAGGIHMCIQAVKMLVQTCYSLRAFLIKTKQNVIMYTGHLTQIYSNTATISVLLSGVSHKW